MTTQTCEDRIEGEWAKTRQDLNRSTDEELADIKQGKFLCYDYIESKMYNSTRKNNASIGYWRYQMSTGGPGDEIRFYDNDKVTYAFLDWFDGAEIDITDEPVVDKLRMALPDHEVY